MNKANWWIVCAHNFHIQHVLPHNPFQRTVGYRIARCLASDSFQRTTATLPVISENTNLNQFVDKLQVKTTVLATQKETNITKSFTYTPKVELRVRSRKRLFLEKSGYLNSSFSCLSTGLKWPTEGHEAVNVSYNLSKYEYFRKAKEVEEKFFRALGTSSRDFREWEDLNEDEVWLILDNLMRYHLLPGKNFLTGLKTYCQKQLIVWNTDKLLKICDWWHIFQRLDSDLFSAILEQLSLRHQLQTWHLVEIFYFISEYLTVHPSVVSVFIDKVVENVRELDNLELTTVCGGFIKCRPRIHSKALAIEVTSRIPGMAVQSDTEIYCLVTMLRFMSRSYHRNHDSLQEVAGSLTPMLPTLKFIAVPHVVTAFAKLRSFHKNMYDAIAESTLFAIKDAEENGRPMRLKNIWMLIWAFARINYRPGNGDSLFQGLIRQLALNEKPSRKFPLQYVKSLVALCFLDIYPLELINLTLSPPYLKICEEYGVPDLYKHLVILDNSVMIERPQYTGNRLPQIFRERCLQVPHGTTTFTPELRNETRFVLDALSRVVAGRERVKSVPILPHIRTPGDIEVDLSDKPHATTLTTDEHRVLIPKPLDIDAERYAILIQLEKNYRFTPRKLLGVHAMKKRQLSRLGYKVAEIPYYEWLPLLRQSDKRQRDYIRKKLSDAKNGK